MPDLRSGFRTLVCLCCGGTSRQWCRDVWTPSGDNCVDQARCPFGLAVPDFTVPVDIDADWREGPTFAVSMKAGSFPCECSKVIVIHERR